eukprot:Rmarinus@m.5706
MTSPAILTRRPSSSNLLLAETKHNANSCSAFLRVDSSENIFSIDPTTLPLTPDLLTDYVDAPPLIQFDILIDEEDDVPELVNCAKSVACALSEQHHPVPVETCVSGCYFLQDMYDNTCGVFKPCDEEPGMPNNPKNYTSTAACEHALPEGSLRVMRPGQSAIREVAAYLLDSEGFQLPNGYAGIPQTALALAAHPAFNDRNGQVVKKLGSFQVYEPHDCTVEDVGPGLFDAGQVHRIAIFDMRVLNLDRHAGNVLVRFSGQQADLIPIDHGFILPEDVVSPLGFEWMNWPQSREPFSEDELNYIASLDAELDGDYLREKLLSQDEGEGSILTLTICTMFVQQAAAAGLTAFDIGALMIATGVGADDVSRLENACNQAKEEAKFPDCDERSYLDRVRLVLTDLINEVVAAKNKRT